MREPNSLSNSSSKCTFPVELSLPQLEMYMFRAFYQSAQFINWPAQSRNYRLGAQFINRVRNLEIESRASNERSVHVLYIVKWLLCLLQFFQHSSFVECLRGVEICGNLPLLDF